MSRRLASFALSSALAALLAFGAGGEAFAQQTGAGGGGGISSVTAGAGLAATAGTCGSGSGATLSSCNGVNTQTGNYSLLAADAGKTINCNASGGCTFTIPQAGTTGFETGRTFCLTSQQGAVTLSPTTSTIYGPANTASFAVNQTMCLQSDGTNYLGTGGAPVPAGVVRALRRITAAGAVTVTTADDIVCIAKASGAATTVNMPASPTAGQVWVIKDCKGDAATNNITITPNSGNIDGAGTYVMNTNYAAATVTYDGTQLVVLAVK